ncbi:hypothetical protein SAMN03080615_01614 [Amphritea atlantica]|uniref:DUF551 domain-containing protein n=1 Tax=Amphritea atlantica TaxID=355243 RepID=A0A1H9GD49_9GAMM|nr:hypothetical protein [Amphritea atlantica]SEQ47989.1 hypothetical protein SAMN03080615_01614 [Amphritea atlantica]
MWHSAETPPKGSIHLWTRDVITVTNHGNVYLLAYMHGENSGTWQRPEEFEPGEQVELWTEHPDKQKPKG